MKMKTILSILMSAIVVASMGSCTSILYDFVSTDYNSFSVNGTYSGRLMLTPVGTTVPTDTAHLQLTLSQTNGAVSGTAHSSGTTIPNGLASIDDAYGGNITSYANYFAHINGYIYPKSETITQAQQNGSAIACDIVVNTLTNIAEGNLFLHPDTTHYVELLLTKQ